MFGLVLAVYVVAMPNLPRKLIIHDQCVFHVAWQCHNRSWFLQEEWSKALYYELLLKYKGDYRMEIYAYHLMENHAHLVGLTASLEGFSCFFRVVHNVFARRVNHRMGRRGQLIMDRLKSPKIEDDRHLLSVMIYNDLNGVRAGRDASPDDSNWSSHKFYARGELDLLITPAPSYLALSDDPIMRQIEYRAIVKAMMNDRLICSMTKRANKTS